MSINDRPVKASSERRQRNLLRIYVATFTLQNDRLSNLEQRCKSWDSNSFRQCSGRPWRPWLEQREAAAHLCTDRYD